MFCGLYKQAIAFLAALFEVQNNVIIKAIFCPETGNDLELFKYRV